MVELVETSPAHHAGFVTPDDLIRLRQARDRMDRDFAERLDMALLAGQSLMSVGHFHRSFKEAFGETPYAWLMTRRIERAMAFFRSTDLSVTDVCMQVGCTSLGSFSSSFTQLVGETPSAYRGRSHDDLRGLPSCIVKQVTRPVRK